jgi:hypothetical protein
MKQTTLISLTTAIFTILVFGASGCQNDQIRDNEPKVLYRAVNKNDTALFKVFLTEKEFYGQFEINHHGVYKDSGDVNGIIKGDTLLGTFHYQSYGVEKWYRIPIALLKKKDQLIMGVGPMEIYMNMTFFTKNIPIDYQHPMFVFEKNR